MCTHWVNSRSFDERVWNNSIGGGDNVDGPTTAFQRCRALATDTPPPMVVQAIKELARTSRTSTKLPDVNVGFKLKLQ
jgi:hypothetical protein